MSPISLSSVAVGDHCVVFEIAAEQSELRSRLYALGIIPGTSLQILRYAPLGDPMQVKVGSSFVSIRKQEANSILVNKP